MYTGNTEIWMVIMLFFLLCSIPITRKEHTIFSEPYLMLAHAGVEWNGVYLCNMFIVDMPDCHRFQVMFDKYVLCFPKLCKIPFLKRVKL